MKRARDPVGQLFLFVFQLSEPSSSIQEQFDEFDRANPWVFDALVRMAREAKDQGRTKIGIKQLFETLRWNDRRATENAEGWKLCNSFTSRYARKIREVDPDLGAMFEFRRLRAT